MSHSTPKIRLRPFGSHTVEHLARQIAEQGEYNRLSLLSDALLDHCREDGVHGPGCWVIDTLLGRMYTRS